jgi:hypothetical protein
LGLVGRHFIKCDPGIQSARRVMPLIPVQMNLVTKYQ